MRLWVAAHSDSTRSQAREFIKQVQLVPFQTFRQALDESLAWLVQQLTAVPEYALVTAKEDETAGTSNVWLSQYALATHLDRCRPTTFYKGRGPTTASTFVVVDDASYSGTQIRDRIACLSVLKPECTIFIAVPFRSLQAEQQLKTKLCKVHMSPCTLIPVCELPRTLDPYKKISWCTTMQHKTPDDMSVPHTVLSGKLIVSRYGHEISLSPTNAHVQYLPDVHPPYKEVESWECSDLQASASWWIGDGHVIIPHTIVDVTYRYGRYTISGKRRRNDLTY